MKWKYTAMKDQLQLSISLPFAYYVTRDSATGSPLLRYPSPRMIGQYIDALCAEMDLWKDCRDTEIAAVRFEGGYIHLLKPEELERILAKLEEVFNLSPSCEWIALTCPGRYLAPMLAPLTQRRFRMLVDIPTFVKAEADDNLLPFGPAFQQGILEDYPVSGIRTLRHIPGRPSEVFQEICDRLSALQPPRVELITLSGQREEDNEGWELANFLLASGYRETADSEFALPAGELRHTHQLSSLPGYIGLGLGAASLYDGYFSRNTDDFKRYTAAAGNPSLLYTEVTELGESGSQSE